MRSVWRRVCDLALRMVIVSSAMVFGAVAATAETRSLDIYHMHTGEHEVITFKRDGVYDQQGLSQLNHILRDWRRNETIRMDPELFDLIWEVYRDTGANGPIQIVCGYRAPETNNMLRARSRGVAQFSQHTLGKAMDFYLPGVPLEKLREVGMKKQIGGVGFYPTSGSPFVHMDTGSVRAWPRMTREQLVRLFPDGKTLHRPADGPDLPGYATAVAEYQRHRGGQQTQVADAGSSGSKGNFFATLFGGKSGEDEPEETAPAQGRTRAQTVAQITPAHAAPAQTAVVQPTPAAQVRPLPAPQPPKPSFAGNLPHLMPRPSDPPPAEASPSAAPFQMASLPIPAARPANAPPAAPVQAAGAILPAGWTTGTAPASSSVRPDAPAPAHQAPPSLQAINVPMPTAKLQAVIGAVPRPRPSLMTASLGSRPFNDAFSALTGTPNDQNASELLGYAPVAPPAALPETRPAQDARAAAAREALMRTKLASLGTSDAPGALPTPGPQTAKQARMMPDVPLKGDRADPMARLVSFVIEGVDSRMLDTESCVRSARQATFVHPDQATVPQMIAKPTRVIADSFGHAPMPLTTGRFTGPAVVALAIIATP